MSHALHAWYSLRDLEALGVRQVELRGELPLRQFARLAELLHSVGGSVKASLRFGQRDHRWLNVVLQYETTVELTCQRCLEPMTERLADTVALAVLESAGMESAVPAGTEAVALHGERLNPAELIEDELIVALPLVPRHARIEDCGSLARLISDPADAHDAPQL